MSKHNLEGGMRSTEPASAETRSGFCSSFEDSWITVHSGVISELRAWGQGPVGGSSEPPTGLSEVHEVVSFVSFLFPDLFCFSSLFAGHLLISAALSAVF